MHQTVYLWWLFFLSLIIVVLIGVIITTLDQGHRGYVVANELAVTTLAPLLKKHSGIIELVTCTTEPVHQVMMSTGLVLTVPSQGISLRGIEPAATLKELEKIVPTTVRMSVQELATQTGYLPNFCSLLATHPTRAVEETAKVLKMAGFSAYILDGFMPQAKEDIALVASDAFVGWILVFRRHLLLMPIPDSPRFLTKKEGVISLPRVMRIDSRFRTWLTKR